jgi:hypothetical protein
MYHLFYRVLRITLYLNLSYGRLIFREESITTTSTAALSSGRFLRLFFFSLLPLTTFPPDCILRFSAPPPCSWYWTSCSLSYGYQLVFPKHTVSDRHEMSSPRHTMERGLLPPGTGCCHSMSD